MRTCTAYGARREGDGGAVALKRYRGPDALLRAHREIDTLRQCRHAAIPEAYELDASQASPVLVMELAPGERLDGWVSRSLPAVHCHLAREPDPPIAIRPDVPARLSELVCKLLCKEPGDRYQSARVLRADLAQVASRRIYARALRDPPQEVARDALGELRKLGIRWPLRPSRNYQSHAWTMPRRRALGPLGPLIERLRETGDVQFTFYRQFPRVFYRALAGDPVPAILEQMKSLVETIAELGIPLRGSERVAACLREPRPWRPRFRPGDRARGEPREPRG